MNIDISQLEFIDKKLREICIFLENEIGVDFTVTSLYRMNNENSVHGMLPLRGVDLRVKNDDIGQVVELP